MLPFHTRQGPGPRQQFGAPRSHLEQVAERRQGHGSRSDEGSLSVTPVHRDFFSCPRPFTLAHL